MSDPAGADPRSTADARSSGAADDQPALVPVLRTTDPAFLPVVKSLLASAGVPYFVQGEEAMGLFPLGSFGGHHDRSRLGAVIHVPAARVDEVRELLAQELDVDDEPVDLTPDPTPERS